MEISWVGLLSVKEDTWGELWIFNIVSVVILITVVLVVAFAKLLALATEEFPFAGEGTVAEVYGEVKGKTLLFQSSLWVSSWMGGSAI